MVSLSNYLVPDSMVQLEPGLHNQMLSVLIQRCLRDYTEAEREKICNALEGGNRMKDQNMGTGFAITHARLDTIGEIRIAVGLLGKEIRFGKGAPVHTIFCAIIPMNKANEYLGFMAKLCRLLTQPGMDKVFAAANPDPIIDQIKAFEA